MPLDLPDRLPDLDPCWRDDGPFKLGPRRIKLSDRLDSLPAPAGRADEPLEHDAPTPAQRRRILRAAAMKLAQRAGFSIGQCAQAFGVSRCTAKLVLGGKQKTAPGPGRTCDKKEASRQK
ncbi:MAG: hypothetical protein AB7W06_17270 [Alphaproteobacteria bacterium]